MERSDITHDALERELGDDKLLTSHFIFIYPFTPDEYEDLKGSSLYVEDDEKLACETLRKPSRRASRS